ncbi:MAG: T9SS type A sorting domain-containing protein [Bacteroidetes bacterium]|nr:T9SS type A sorting domain-containing protein [Bacteroidota bacterium]
MKSKIIFFFLFIQCSFMSAQTININTIEVCAGQEVLLPVTCSSLLNVGAITLFISFDTLNLTFSSLENIDPQLTGMSTNMMTFPSQLAFAWSSTTPINFSTGKLFDLKFITNGQTSPVIHNPGCEVADPIGVIIPVIYNDGAVNSGLPSVTVQPKDTVITENCKAVFSLVSQNAISYFWKESQDNGTSWLTLEDGGIYSGTHSEELSIFPVPLSFDNNQYQCVLIRESCQALSASATLSVDALISTNNLSSPGKKDFYITPVPFTDHTNIEFTLPENGSAMIQVMNCLGQLVYEMNLPSQSRGARHILLNTPDWQPGIYFVKLTRTTTEQKTQQVIKIMKNK